MTDPPGPMLSLPGTVRSASARDARRGWSRSPRTGAVATLWTLTALGALAIIAASATSFGFVAQTLFVSFLAVDALAFTTTGALVELRRPGNRVAWLLLAAGPMIVGTFAGFTGAVIAYQGQSPTPAIAGASVVLAAALFLPMFLAFTLILLLFPDGRLPTRRWRPIAWALTAVVVFATVTGLVAPGSAAEGLPPNPFGVDLPLVAALAPIANAAGTVAVVIGIALGPPALVLRFRRGTPEERQQLKWLVAAVTIFAVVLPISFIPVDTTTGSDELNLIDVAAVASMALIPISIGIAILRYRLYEIDRIVSRSVGYALVTASLVAVFAIGNLVLQTILGSLLGTGSETLAVAASTLLAFGMMQPIRQRIQHAVDRRFDRSRYDAQRAIDAVAAQLRDQVDLDRLRGILMAATSETVRPERIGLWLREGKARSSDPIGTAGVATNTAPAHNS